MRKIEVVNSPFERRHKPSRVTEKASFIFGRSTGFGEGYAAGLKAGARRERRALKRVVLRCATKGMVVHPELQDVLWPRSKRKPPKGGEGDGS